MRRTQATRTGRQRLLILSLVFLLSFPAAGASPAPIVGRILAPDQARVVVRHESCRCGTSPGSEEEIRLLTVGTESERDGGPHFHPLASLAFDPTLSDDTGQWMALWTFGPSPPGWRRTLRSALPLPVGAPRASAKEVERLDAWLAEIQERPGQAALQVPEPVIHLANLGRPARSQGIWAGLRRGLDWAGVMNPAQFLFRAHLMRRQDRRERLFQRTYLSLQWLLDVEYAGEDNPVWLASVNDLRFHLLRNRSFFGRWVEHADALELIYNYESDVRVKTGKASSWLQSAANEHALRYQPIYRYTENRAAFPIGGVLYYDPRLGLTSDPGWWRIANPFDLPYNPHLHPKVQRLAREHPDEPIPLAVYTFETKLALRPIIVVDFFAPGNPRSRESSQQLMVLLKNWLSLTTGTLSFERLPYRVISWAANKKGFTRLVDKSSRLGIEELRLALESDLYVDPAVRARLLERVDQRVLNPMIKPGGVEERLAHIQYESLRARDHQTLCRTVEEVRHKVSQRLKVPPGLAPEAQRRELARRLRAWQQQVRLEDAASQPLGDFGSLGRLEEPLRYFLQDDPIDPRVLEDLLAELYAKLYTLKLRLPADRPLPELESTLALTRQVWERSTPTGFSEQLARREDEAQVRVEKEHRQEEKRRLEALRKLLEDTHAHLQQARRAGCQTVADAPAELDARLALLWEVAQAVENDAELRAEFSRHILRLERELDELQAALEPCPFEATEPWRAAWRESCLELARALRQALGQAHIPRVAGGG